MRKILFSLLVAGVSFTGIQGTSAMEVEDPWGQSSNFKPLSQQDEEFKTQKWVADLEAELGLNKRRRLEYIDYLRIIERQTKKRKSARNLNLDFDIADFYSNPQNVPTFENTPKEDLFDLYDILGDEDKENFNINY